MRRIVAMSRVLFAVIFLSTAAGCRSQPGIAYSKNAPPGSDTAPKHFTACPTPRGELNVVERSYAAMLRSLTDLKWRIEYTSETYDRIVGRGCLGVDANLCVIMHFDVENPQGGFVVYAPQDHPIVNKMAGHVMRWMHFLDQKYTNYRCMDDTMATEELRLFSLAPQSATKPSMWQRSYQPLPNQESPTPPQPQTTDSGSVATDNTAQ